MNLAPPVNTDTAPSKPIQKRERPPITEEEDRPLDESASNSRGCGDSPRINTIEEKEQDHKHKVEDYKNIVGGILISICFVIIIVFSLMDANTQIESSLFTGAFEFAKTIATAIIGYLFATNIKSK